MLFSVLMAHYNNARFLKESLRSVCQQVYKNWEVIIVDDASTDSFEEVIAEFLHHPRIRIFRNEKNMGCAFTKRKCVEKANGTILGFLDPDDALHPDALKIMLKAHIDKPGCSLIHSTHYICNENLRIKSEAGYQRALPKRTPYLLINDGSIHHFATFKKTCYNRTAGITPVREYNKGIDQDLYYLLEEQGNIFFINKPLYYYRIHTGGISTLKNASLAKLGHYTIIEEACLRRIEKLKASGKPDAAYWIKKYQTRYYKIRIFNSFRRHNWGTFFSSLLLFPFKGGMKNIVDYFKKLPKEGFSLLRKSFIEN